MKWFQTIKIDLYLSLLVFDAEISSIGSKETSNAGARLLVCTLASKTHQQLPNILNTVVGKMPLTNMMEDDEDECFQDSSFPTCTSTQLISGQHLHILKLPQLGESVMPKTLMQRCVTVLVGYIQICPLPHLSWWKCF